MKKIMLLATMLAMLALSAVPAMAQPRIVAPNAFRDADLTTGDIDNICGDVDVAFAKRQADIGQVDQGFGHRRQ